TVRDDAAHVVGELRIIPGIEVHDRHEREKGLLVARAKSPNGIPCRGMSYRTVAPRRHRPHHAQLRFFGVASDHDALIERVRNERDASTIRFPVRSSYGWVTLGCARRTRRPDPRSGTDAQVAVGHHILNCGCSGYHA